MTLALVILIIGVIFNLFIAGLVSLKRQDKSARYLGIVALILIFWEVTNYLADVDGTHALFWNKAAFAGPPLIVLLSYYFVRAIKNQSVSKLFTCILGSTTLFVVALVFSSLVVKGVTPRQVEGEIVGYSPIYGPLYLFYLAWIALLVILHAANVAPSIKETNVRFSQQMRLVRIGTIAAILVPVITNLILPNLLGNSVSAKFVPIMSIVYMGALAIAILKHKMLDIRSFVLRAAAYTVTAVILGILYIAPLMFVLMKILDLPFYPDKFIIAVIVGTFAATNYHKLRDWFDTVTKRIFFRDAYDPTEMIAELNKQLVGTVDVDRMFASTANLIERNLKPEFCYFFLKTTEGHGAYRMIGGKGRKIKKEYTANLLSLLDKQVKESNVFSDMLSPLSELRKVFTEQDIAGVARLASRESKEPIGYMIVGVKKSGRGLDLVDTQVIESVSGTLYIAVQNALHYEEIQQFNKTLQAKVSSATRELRATNDKLKKLDETKDEFISMASHQLRTPLTSVKGYLSMVIDGDVGRLNKQQRELLTQSYLSSQRMVELISDLLNLSRLSTGKFVIDYGPVDLRDVVEQELLQIRDTAAAREVDLIYEAPKSFPVVRLDNTKIHQVVMNFIDNAIYYNSAGGRVEVQLLDTPSAIEFRVIDNGIGVPRELQRHLFTKFYRADNARRVRPDGTGLGLFMAKKVILAQGGSIIFESEEGRGSTFGFRFSKEVLADKNRNHPVELQA